MYPSVKLSARLSLLQKQTRRYQNGSGGLTELWPSK